MSGAAGKAPSKAAGKIDVTAWVGSYPFRQVPHPDPEVLVRVLEREGFGGAWVGHLPGTFHRDPTASNAELYKLLSPFRNSLWPVPLVRPGWPRWEATLKQAKDEGAPAVRVSTQQLGIDTGGAEMKELAYAAGEAGLVLHLTVRLEDLRQRHPLDSTADLPAAGVRALARLPQSKCKILVAGAGKDLIEEIYWGLTPQEQQRVWYDFHWVWGPPEHHFSHLVRAIGAERFAWSSWWPLRLTQQSRVLVDLLPEDLRDCEPHLADGFSIVMS